VMINNDTTKNNEMSAAKRNYISKIRGVAECELLGGPASATFFFTSFVCVLGIPRGGGSPSSMKERVWIGKADAVPPVLLISVFPLHQDDWTDRKRVGYHRSPPRSRQILSATRAPRHPHIGADLGTPKVSLCVIRHKCRLVHDRRERQCRGGLS
jgi:hypothetical protein